jgi:dienelactone hydrolase
MRPLTILAVAVAVLAVLVPGGEAAGAIKHEAVAYKDGKIALEGYIAYDDAVKGKRPAVLIVHDWMGLSDHTRAVADKLAAQGYVAFAVDIYGKGVRPRDAAEAGKLAGTYKKDAKLLRARAAAGLATLVKHPRVDATRVVAIGYCFGGTTALELGRSGAQLAGIVSFHGGLATATPADARNIKGKVLVLHGADDPHVPRDEVGAFEKEMREGGVDWQLVSFGGAVHAFTVPGAGNDPKKGVAYDAKADARSWKYFMDFLGEIAPAS